MSDQPLDDDQFIPPDELEIAYRQVKQINMSGSTLCATCSEPKKWIELYNCLYCKRYFCFRCGELHFGETRRAHWYGKN